MKILILLIISMSTLFSQGYPAPGSPGTGQGINPGNGIGQPGTGQGYPGSGIGYPGTGQGTNPGNGFGQPGTGQGYPGSGFQEHGQRPRK